MSRDNWERLVAATIKREQIWQMFHSHSRETSISSISSDFDFGSSSQLDENSEFEVEETQLEKPWIDEYKPGVYITVVNLKDGSRQLNRVRFSRKYFGHEEVEAWWRENQDKVYERYNIRFAPDPVIKGTGSENGKNWTEEYEPGIDVTLGGFSDGTRQLKKIRFSKGRFNALEAEAWWSVNREKVLERYNAWTL